MHRWWRISFLGAVILVTGCVGGPVSDLPHSGDDDGKGNPGSGPGVDGGASSGGKLDAGIRQPEDEEESDDAGVPCDDAGTDAAADAS